MKISLLSLGLAFLLLCGCAASNAVGSQNWYQTRMQEIETSFTKGEITKADYLRLKNEADSIRASYMDSGRPRTGIGFGYSVLR
jgi:hypothetical protein